MRFWIMSAALLAISAPALAQFTEGESEVTAANGIIVDVNADSFAGRYELSAPVIKEKSEKGASLYAFVAKIKRSESSSGLNIQGFISYSGHWRYYQSAVFQGGEEVDYTRTGGDVGSCRYGCSLTENFMIELTPEQIAKYGSDGTIKMQIRSMKSTDKILLTVPVSYIKAVEEVSAR